MKNLVDVTGIEPVTPCLQRTGVLSNGSVHYFGFPMVSIIWGACFSLEAKPNAMKTFDSRTVRAQSPAAWQVSPEAAAPWTKLKHWAYLGKR
jgi:hypothetical protein